MSTSTYLIFGDLHGRVLPAFALARAWQRDHAEPVTAVLQVGDLGYYPFLDRLDRATKKHAHKDFLELGVQHLLRANPVADELFTDSALTASMWFVAGNHEDHQALIDLYGMPGSRDNDYPVDHYRRLNCIVDGNIAQLPGGLRVAGVWGIDQEAPRARRHIVPEARLDVRRTRQLSTVTFDVLLSHESPRDAFWEEAGSEALSLVIEQAQPAFAFFGHYHGEAQGKGRIGKTSLFHLGGLEFRGKSGCAEERSVGLLRMNLAGATFEYVEPAWLRSITRHNWQTR
jgi:Icc-related predicted phosphoesterase